MSIQLSLRSNAARKALSFVLTAFVSVSISWLLYCWYYGIALHVPFGSYPGPVDPALDSRIRQRMVEVQEVNAHRASHTVNQRCWDEWEFGPGPHQIRLRELGIQILPLIERKTRSVSSRTRKKAYDMLRLISIADNPSTISNSHQLKKEWEFRRKYIIPIWHRALKDDNPEIRCIAARNFRHKDLRDDYLTPISSLMRDPDLLVRVQAAKILIYTYDSPHLVPPRLRVIARNWGVE